MQKTLPLLIPIFGFLMVQPPALSAEPRQCRYTYNSPSTKLEWTAYKFTEKVGVNGTFDKIIVTKDTKKANSIQIAMANARFSIPTAQVNSGVPDRDEKIRKYFFGSSPKAKVLEGFFKNITGTDSGKADLVLTFNGKTETIPVTYEIQKNLLSVAGSLDVARFGMLPGINKLNEVCRELHIGKDGVSKLWSEVDFKITSEFREDC